MLGVLALTFCIFFGGVNSLPVYPAVAVPSYAPAAVDPYPISPYPAVDPYASPAYVPSLDYYQVPQQVSYNPYQQVLLYDPYSLQYPGGYPVQQSYLQVDPYAQSQAYPQIDPYASAYPQIDPYASAYPQVDPYAQVYPSVDPYINAYPQVDPYVQPYPQVDPYLQPYPQPDPYQPSTSYPIQPQVYSASPPPYLDPYSLSVPQSYQLAPVYPQPSYPAYEQVDTYLAVTSHTKDYRKHCGILPATNDDIYSDSIPGSVNDVLPYGAFPWLALVVDLDDYTVPCLATMIHSEYALTVSSCITKPAGSYAFVKDWDILTKYNEYEAYKSYADPVCTYWPLGVDNSSGEAMFTLANNYNSELTLLIGPLEEHHSQYPADEILCLPSQSSALPSSYANYAPPPYSPLPYPSYSPLPPPPPYSPYPQVSYDYSNAYIPTGECWVAGYRSSPTAILQNHPPSVPVSGAPPQYPPNQDYYNTLDNSMVPRKALVRQIQCPAGYPSAGYDDVCFVGINGYDACVADIGTAVFCVIDDSSKPYESGFVTDKTSNHGVIPEPGNVQSQPPSQPIVQQQPIQVLAAQPQQTRRRAVLYAVVKVPAYGCMAPTSPSVYQPNYQQQSNYLVGARVNPSIRAALQDLFWETGYDLSCPTQKVGDVLPISGNQAYPSYPPTPIQPQLYDPSLSVPSVYPQPSPVYQQPIPYQPPSPY